MRKTLKHHTRPVPVTEQNEYLPDTPFVTIFGTSHSYGCCIDGEKDFVENDQIWVNKIGRPTVNFSAPGTTNKRILHTFQDFLELPNHKNSDTIIVEARLADRTYNVGGDLPGGEKTFADIAATNNFLSSAKPFGGQNWYQKLCINMPTFDKRKNKSQEDIAQLADHQPHVIEIVNNIREGAQAQSISVLNVAEDLMRIRTMQTLAKLSGKKFYWFCWDEYSLNGSKEWKWLLDVFEASTDVLDSCVSLSISRELHEIKNKYMCECGHQTAPFHDEVAKIIKKHIDKDT
jgi:hypothetical protein